MLDIVGLTNHGDLKVWTGTVSLKEKQCFDFQWWEFLPSRNPNHVLGPSKECVGLWTSRLLSLSPEAATEPGGFGAGSHDGGQWQGKGRACLGLWERTLRRKGGDHLFSWENGNCLSSA